MLEQSGLLSTLFRAANPMDETIIVIPCFNEEKRLQPEVFERYAATHPSLLLLFVDDGSTDHTADIIKTMQQTTNGHMEILQLKTNQGKAEAVRRGFLAACDKNPLAIGFWDADLATPLDQIDPFLEILKADPSISMVFGVRNDGQGTIVERAFFRHAVGNCFAWFSSRFFTLPVYDTQCGAKLFRYTPHLRHAFEKTFLTKWLFDIEIFARLSKEQGAAATLPQVRSVIIPVWKDIGGSKVRFSDYLLSFSQFLKIYRSYPHLRTSMRSAPPSHVH